MEEYEYEIEYVKGKEIKVADCLSINLLVEPIIKYEERIITQKSNTITNIIKRDFTILINAKKSST